jgi:hypothetical protein
MPQTVMVFSHPNHEIAVLGTILRLRPHIVYLTDGGGEARVNQTRQALQGYQPVSVHYLNYSEQRFYDALLGGDSKFFRALAVELGILLKNIRDATVFCDAVEIYNPVHDIALPVVLAALASADPRLFEIPLIYQKKGSVEAFELQHVPESLSSVCVCLKLSEEERDRKIATIKSHVYKALFAQLGHPILDALESHAGCEYFLKGRRGLPLPAPEQVLRYEMRGRMLKDLGAVPGVITYGAHYAPIFEALCAAPLNRSVRV